MKMSNFEKQFVNTEKHAKKNIKTIELLSTKIDLPKTKKVLEIGCGVGVVTHYLANKYNWGITGTDVDLDQIKIAKKNNKENNFLKFFEADATNLPFSNDEFDLVLSFFVLHHISNWEKAIVEISRVLKPGGFYILHDISLPLLFANIFRAGGFTFDRFINNLKENGLKIIYKNKTRGNFIKKFDIICEKRDK